jgi:hypothetical protein
MHTVQPTLFKMEYEFEQIEMETPDAEWLEDLARLFAEIIYTQTMQKVKPDEEEPDIL